MYDEKYQLNFPNSNYLSNLNNLNGTNQSIHLNRLPTLGEILANKSKSPVDLFTFYQFMKDVEGKVDYLDFWFDLINHLNLCKHYVKGLRDSIVRQSGTFSHHNNNRLSQSHQSGAYTNDTLDLQQQQQSQQSQQQPQAQQQSQQQSQQRFSAPRNAMHRSSDSPSIPSNRQSSGARPISETSQKHKSLSSSILLDLIINDNILEENDSHRLSAFLRGDISLDNIDPKLKELIEQYNAETDAENRYSNEPLQSPLSPAFQTSARSSASLGSRSNNPFLPQQPLPKLKHLQRQEKRVSSQSHLIDQYNDDDFLDRDHDHDHDHEDDDSSVDLHPHSGDSLYDNQLDIGQADRAVHASKYVSLNSNSNKNNNNFNANANANTDTNHQQQIHNMQNTQPLAQPPNMFGDTGNLVYPQPKNKRASVINPSLLERLIRDSPAMSNKASSFVTRDNLRGSSHNLLLKYFVEDSEKNLNLPPQLNSYIIKLIEVDGRDDPDIFNYVKTFVFNKLENDHLPKFLDFTATRNINHSNFGRIITGFFFLFGAFWISFIFVFLNYRKGLRPVIVAPFFIAFYFIISSIYLVDPILAWLGLLETFSKSNGKSILRIEEKFIYKFIVKRSLWVMFLILVMTAIFTVLFSLVPGHRL